MEGEPTWQPLLSSVANEGTPTISPSGNWIAYSSDETGEREVYVARFPTLEDRQPVSSEGGWAPTFSPDGRELFYRTNRGLILTAGGLMKVPIVADAALTMGMPEMVFEGPYYGNRSSPRWYDQTHLAASAPCWAKTAEHRLSVAKDVAPPTCHSI